jgi:hypothetical protein
MKAKSKEKNRVKKGTKIRTGVQCNGAGAWVRKFFCQSRSRNAQSEMISDKSDKNRDKKSVRKSNGVYGAGAEATNLI